MRKFENCVLLTRVGGFYELYFEHADDYGPLLNLKVATKKTNAGPVPMVSRTLNLYQTSHYTHRLGYVQMPRNTHKHTIHRHTIHKHPETHTHRHTHRYTHPLHLQMLPQILSHSNHNTP